MIDVRSPRTLPTSQKSVKLLRELHRNCLCETPDQELLIGDACLPRLATGFTTSFGTLSERWRYGIYRCARDALCSGQVVASSYIYSEGQRESHFARTRRGLTSIEHSKVPIQKQRFTLSKDLCSLFFLISPSARPLGAPLMFLNTDGNS